MRIYLVVRGFLAITVGVALTGPSNATYGQQTMIITRDLDDHSRYVEALIDRRADNSILESWAAIRDLPLDVEDRDCQPGIYYRARSAIASAYRVARDSRGWRVCQRNDTIVFEFQRLGVSQITFLSWGGSYEWSQVRGFQRPFMELNPDITIVNDARSANALAGLRVQSQAGNVAWDLIEMLPSDAQLACDEGILMQIDHDSMLAPGPEGRLPTEDFFLGSLGECYVPTSAFSTVIAYNTEMFPVDKQPQAVADFFDVENFPGRRAIQDRPGVNLEWALLADGVAVEEIYDMLQTEEGVERAFAKLDTIKDYLIFWTEGAQSPQLLADKEVAFATGYNPRFFWAAEAEGQPIKIIWHGQVVEWAGWAVPSASPNLEVVLDYLYFATDPQRLAELGRYLPYGPARQSSRALVSTHAELGIDMSPHMPTHPDNYETAIELNNDFWTDYGDELRERFDIWMSQ